MSQKAAVVSLLNGLFTEVYGDDLISLVPKAARLQKDAPFVSREKREGNQYHQPVRLTRAHGWTLSTSGDAFALNPPEPARTKDATVQGSSFVLREAISYDAAAKLASGKGAGRKKEFISGTAFVMETMAETAAFVLELQLLYGQASIGTINARTNDSGTTQTFSITAATWIAALWSGMEQGFIDIYDGATLLTTAQVTGTTMDSLAVEFFGVEAELDLVAAATNPTLYLRGTKDAGMVGLVTQVANTGTLFGINGADYSLWTGNTYSAASGTLSFAKFIRAMNKPVGRGLMSDCIAYVSPASWVDCQNDLAALRRYAQKAGGKIEQGDDSLVYHCQAGSVELVPHILMMPSLAVAFPKDKLIRVGASDFTFGMPGMGSSGAVWESLPDHAGVGTRCYWNQALFNPAVCQSLLINEIVNSAS